jgi:hypothetical protein
MDDLEDFQGKNILELQLAASWLPICGVAHVIQGS